MPARVLAGPGTGKSATLVALIGEMVKEKPAPRVRLLTFTRAATAELANKLEDHPAAIVERPSTIHSFAISVLLRNGSVGDLPRPLRIADDWERHEIVRPTLARRAGVGVKRLDLLLRELAAAGAFARAVTFDRGPADDPIPTVRETAPAEPAPYEEGVYRVTIDEDGCTLEGRNGPVDTRKIRFDLGNSTGDYPVTFDIGRISPKASYKELTAFFDYRIFAGIVGVHRPPFFEAPLRGYSLQGHTGHYFAKSLLTLDTGADAGYWESWWRADRGPVPAGTYAVVCYRGKARQPVGVVGPVVVR